MTLDSNGLQIPAHELEKMVCCDFSGDDRVAFWSELAKTIENYNWHNELDSHKFIKWLRGKVKSLKQPANA